MISIEVKRPRSGDSPNQVLISLDGEGLRSLLAQLRFLADGRTDHLDLMSESWGGTFLSDTPYVSVDNHPVHYVKIAMRAATATPPKRGEAVTRGLSEREISDIEARVAAARQGPWKSMVEGRDHQSGSHFIKVGEDPGQFIEPAGATIADQDFIAAARQDVPRLLEEVRRLRKLLALPD